MLAKPDLNQCELKHVQEMLEWFVLRGMNAYKLLKP